MTSPQAFRAIVSGRRRGPAAALARAILRSAEVPYTWAVARRNRSYDTGRRSVHSVAVPVASVGNLTLGGTGKTPLVEWVARYFRSQAVRVAIVSRGYRSTTGAPNDEALELAARLPDVPHVQQADRVAAAASAVAMFGCQAIVLDDGFQHRRLRRDLDMVLIDALEPWGFDHVFPRGTLREPIAGLGRAAVVVLSRADMVSDLQRADIRRRVASLAPNSAWAESIHAPRQLRAFGGTTAGLESLAGMSVAALCGIGNPAGFRHTLDGCGCHVVAWREFADHYPFGAADVEQLAHWADASGAAAVLCTHKDLVKLRVDRIGRLPLYAVEIGLQLTVGQEQLIERLQPLVEQARRQLP